LGHKRDIKQFRQACQEAGLTVDERYEASKALHSKKKALGENQHMRYQDLVEWLRQWKED
jgi:hypothetical protein